MILSLTLPIFTLHDEGHQTGKHMANRSAGISLTCDRKRLQGDRVFVDHSEIIKTYPDDQSCIVFLTSWKLCGRSKNLFSPPTKEVDWFDKSLIIPDKGNQFPTVCTAFMFMITHNNYKEQELQRRTLSV